MDAEESLRYGFIFSLTVVAGLQGVLRTLRRIDAVGALLRGGVCLIAHWLAANPPKSAACIFGVDVIRGWRL